MKILRILTGTHAGIQARLTPGRYRIGKADDTDICITDWDDHEVVVEMDDAGVVRVSRFADTTVGGAAADEADPVVILVPDFVPFPFGTTVLCFGTEEAQWPPDIQLLASMYNGGTNDAAAQTNPEDRPAPNEDRPAGKLRMLRTLCVASMAGAALVIAGSLASGLVRQPRAASGPTLGKTDLATLSDHEIGALAGQLNAALKQARLADLHARQQGHAIVVDGMALNASEDIAARAILERVGRDSIARRYDVAQADVASMSDSLGMDSVHVAYAGDGVFTLSGSVPSLAPFHDQLERLRTDLDGNIKRIDVDVTEVPTNIPMNQYTEMISVGDTRYVQTADGVKHLFPATAATSIGNVRTLHESITPLGPQAQ
jgi:type III secretion protein D